MKQGQKEKINDSSFYGNQSDHLKPVSGFKNGLGFHSFAVCVAHSLSQSVAIFEVTSGSGTCYATELINLRYTSQEGGIRQFSVPATIIQFW